MRSEFNKPLPAKLPAIARVLGSSWEADHKYTQRLTLLAALIEGPVSTTKAREELGIGSPAARIFELRKQGYPIKTIWATHYDAWGRPHTGAEYHLMNGARN